MTATEETAPARVGPHDPMDDPEVAARVAEYLELPYTITMVYDTSPGGPPAWVVWVEELPGCISQGDTAEEATQVIREAMELWIGGHIEEGRDVPPPKDRFAEHSGKFQVRLPVGLHGKLAAVAEDEGVSLNQLVTAILAEGVGWRPAGDRKRKRSRT